MNKKLIIAEKPSVALDIVKALNNTFEKKEAYYESDDMVISYAVGHLITISEPQEMDEKYKTWSLKNLPIIPKQYALKPINNNKKQLNVLVKLLERKDIDTVINACDSGREGELIFRYIIDYLENISKTKAKIKANAMKKTLKRLWLQSMTPASIREGLQSLRNDEDLLPLAQAAKSRAEADWLVGINASRGLTAYISKHGGFFNTPCGRVQTPTLSMIYNREKERENFIPKDYWLLIATFVNDNQIYTGKWFDKNIKKVKKHNNDITTSQADKIWSEDQAKQLEKKCQGKLATVSEKTKASTINAPNLYDLTTLQREANNRFGYSAKRTLGILQALYEKYKVLTYPRTDSKYLPEDYLSTVKNLFQLLTKNPLVKTHAEKALKENYVVFNKRVFNNQKVSDHHAIIPTTIVEKKLPEVEYKIYILVVQRFLAIFYPAAKYQLTTRISEVEGESFKTEGKILTHLGWKIVYTNKEEEKIIPALNQDKDTVLKQTEIKKDTTKPSPRYSEATLLSAMESAGKKITDERLRDVLKERGIGTPATRAQTIEKLIMDKYVVREDRTLIPTTKAFELMNLIKVMGIKHLASPELTGEWEYKLNLIEKNNLPRENFMGEIEEITSKIVESIQGFNEDTTQKEASFSPINDTRFYETILRYYSEDKSIVIKKIMGGKRLSADEMKTLLVEKKLGPLEGFRSKKGIPFTATLVLENNKAKFVFNNQKNTDDIDITNCEVIGSSPVDGSKVYHTMTAYISESAIEKKDTGLFINKVILGKEITVDNIKLLLSAKKTELITNFRSTKTKRLFDAFLELENGKIKFSFPEKKSKATKKS